MDKNKQKVLDAAIKDIEKKYGKGAVMKLSDRPTTDVAVVSSGSLLIDQALGVGGYPRGRIIEIFGPESSGKTTLALHAIAEAQKAGLTAAFIDAEQAIDPEYARNLGVKIEDLILSQPESGEQGLDITDNLIKSGVVDLVVVDSVAALVPQAELDGEMDDQQMGLQARMMAKALRKMSSSINSSNTIVIFINQLREKIGVMFGNPETTPGGRALKFYSSVRVDIRRGKQIKEGMDIVGNDTTVRIVKNKVAPPFKTANIRIYYGKGVSRMAEVVEVAIEHDIVNKSGSWYSYGTDRAQGLQGFYDLLEEVPEMYAEIEQKVLNVIRGVKEDEGQQEAESKPKE